MSLSRLAAHLLIALGVVLLAVGGHASLALFRAPEPQMFVGPGETRIAVRQGSPRTLWIYLRPDPARHGRYPAVPAVRAAVRSEAGAEVTFVPTNQVMSVNARTSRRYVLGDFQFDAPGDYVVRVEAPLEKYDYALTDAGHGARVARFALGVIFGIGGLIGGGVWLAFLAPESSASAQSKPASRKLK